MAYLIDGHNLIGQLHDISLADPNDEAKLVQKLRGFAARTGSKKVIVIFDKGMPAGASGLSNGTVEVIFASHITNADNVMIERINYARDPQHWVVVSSDNQVLDAAKNRKMKIIRSSDFAKQLNTPQPVQPASKLPPKRRDLLNDTKQEMRMSAAELDDLLKAFTPDDN